MPHLTLSGRNNHRHSRTVYLDDVKIGVVSPNGEYWKAIDNKGRNHGDRYLSDWDAAKQLSLGYKVDNPQHKKAPLNKWIKARKVRITRNEVQILQ